jgi:ureidoglycolate lyase/seryl-tRNA synthetase
MQQPIDYLSPDVPAELPWHDVPLLVASDDTVQSYGYLVDDPDDFEIEIVQWPALGWRPIDAGTGDEGGVVEGIFHSEWRGEVLHGHNDAVDGSYILGWSTNPGAVDTDAPTIDPERVLLWHMNYHPDGGQLFYPLDGQPFVVPGATTSGSTISLPSGAMAARACTYTRGSGTRVCFLQPTRNPSGIDRVACMRA